MCVAENMTCSPLFLRPLAVPHQEAAESACDKCGTPDRKLVGLLHRRKHPLLLILGKGPDFMAQSLVTYKSIPIALLLEEFLPLGMLSHSFASEEAVKS